MEKAEASVRCRASGLLRGWRQELVVNQRLQCVAERDLGINCLCEPGLAQLDGAHEGPRSLRGAISEREVRMLVALANQLPQVSRPKIVLCDDLVPDTRVFSDGCCQARWRVRPCFDAEGFGDGRPPLAPLAHVCGSDVASLVRCPRTRGRPYER